MDSLSPDDTRLGSMRQVVEKWNQELPHPKLEIEADGLQRYLNLRPSCANEQARA